MGSFKFSEETIRLMMEDMVGWCQYCKDFTNECVEPDAEEYECDVCCTDNVYGTEHALICGWIEQEDTNP